MSDILIKNMKMPKNCLACPLIDETLSCSVTGRQYPFWENIGRLSDCPITEIKPHGSLIDRDALLESIKEARKKDPDVEDVYIDDYFIVAEWLMSAPTIIEAEGGE